MAKTKAQARKERLDRVRAQQKRQDRRQAVMIWGIVAVVVALLVGFVAFELIRRSGGGDSIEGVQTFEDLPRDHVSGQVSYEQTPPAGGQHNQVWQNCGIYDEPVQNENAVHSLEHGSVWITYRPDLPDDQVERLRDLVRGEQFLLLSPYPELPSPVVASAWGLQLQLDDADDPRLEQFIREYQKGPQTLEQNAICTNGVGTPIST